MALDLPHGGKRMFSGGGVVVVRDCDRGAGGGHDHIGDAGGLLGVEVSEGVRVLGYDSPV